MDNIIIGDGTYKDETICETPSYGHFVVVINKMMGDASNEQLFLELMTPEPPHIPGYEERNLIRQKMSECFAGVSVIGLPILTLEEGQEVDYPILNERFKSGLTDMANVILENSVFPRTVPIGGVPLELNSTTAVLIISTLIEEANKGKIDLTGFEAFWNFITWKVDNEMVQSEEILDISMPLCQQNLQCAVQVPAVFVMM